MAVNERSIGGANGDAERDPRLGRLYREAAGETPPAHLDTAILAAARREVGARPRALAPALRRWHVPVSIAAVVIVSVTLVILLREEGVMHLRYAEVPEAATQRFDKAAAPPAQPMQAEAERRSVQPPAATPELLRHQESRDEARRATALGKLEERARREPEPTAASGAGTVATPELAVKPAPRTLQMEAAPPQVAKVPAAPELADAVTAGKAAAAPATPSEPLAARPAADAPQAKPMAGIRSAMVPGQDRLPVWHSFDKEPPEKWLAHIEELRKQGRAAEAEEMRSEFKRRFPEHPVPAASK